MKKILKISFSIFLLVTFILQPALSQTAREFYDKGLESQSNEEWYSAQEFFLQAVKQNPSYADAYIHLAECAYQLEQWDLALHYLESAGKYKKSDSHVRNLRAFCMLALGDIAGAKSIFQDSLTRFPNDIEARFGVGQIELYEGRTASASANYEEALVRSPSNRQALLTLAFLSANEKKFSKAREYMDSALRSYSGEKEVHYLHALFSSLEGKLDQAEKEARTALLLDENYDVASEMLSSILYEQKKYNEVIGLSEERIQKNRNAKNAFYIKGLAEQKLGYPDIAIETWTQGLQVDPLDELMRCALENEVNKIVPIEDSRRESWAQYHIKNAEQYMKRYDSIGASYEYQKALKVHPTNEKARLAFADLLDVNGLHELYLEQLRFAKDNREPLESISSTSRRERATRTDDTIEAYDSLLEDSLAKQWNVEPFYLDKIRWHLGIYYSHAGMKTGHADNERVSAETLADMFSGVSVTSVLSHVDVAQNFASAYKTSRSSREDYFVMLSLEEGDRDIAVNASMYSSRTGALLKQMTFYAGGNNRYTNVLRSLKSAILSGLPIRGKILERLGNDILIDVGKSEFIANGAIFDIVKKGAVKTADTKLGLAYSSADTLGKLTITKTGEEIAEGVFQKNSFYDNVNTGDEVVLISLAEKNSESANVVDTAANASANGNVALTISTETLPVQANAKKTPALFDLVRSIY